MLEGSESENQRCPFVARKCFHKDIIILHMVQTRFCVLGTVNYFRFQMQQGSTLDTPKGVYYEKIKTKNKTTVKNENVMQHNKTAQSNANTYPSPCTT